MTWYEKPVKFGLLLAIAAALVACEGVGDQSPDADYNHSPLGPGLRIRDVQNPANKLANQTVNITGAVTLWVDTFDETHDGKSTGTVFYEDADTPTDKTRAQLDGLSAYKSTFVPANLVLAPGDVVQIQGQYNEQTSIGTTVTFPAGQFLPQMYKPQVSPMFEVPVPQPVVVTLADLTGFTNARPFIGMLVQLQNITVPYAPAPSDAYGRVAAALTTSGTAGPVINNELYDLNPGSFAANTHFKSITGIVDYFFTIYVCPRSAADLVQ